MIGGKDSRWEADVSTQVRGENDLDWGMEMKLVDQRVAEEVEFMVPKGYLVKNLWYLRAI